MSLSRPTASKIARKLSFTAAVCVGAFGLSAGSALAKTVANAELAVCPGQTFSQPFEALQDSNYYTLVEGSEFGEGAEGWELSGGAQVVAAPDSASGSALDLPSGSEAVSPPVCVTLLYPTARIFVQNVGGPGAVAVSVAYAGTKTEEKPKGVGHLRSESSGWALSDTFNVQPQIGGKLEEVRQVRFHFSTTGKGNDYRVQGLYVDPRMR